MTLDVVRRTRVEPTHAAPATAPPPWAAAPPEAEVAAGRAALREGQYGSAVSRLQTLLNAAGSTLAVDGLLGPVTTRAIAAFQRSRGLAADGRAGHLTWAALTRPLDRVETLPGGRGGDAPGLPALDELAWGGDAAPSNVGDAFAAVSFALEPGRAAAAFSPDRRRREREVEALLRVNGAWPAAEGQVFVVQVDVDPPPPPTRVPPGLRRDERRDARLRLAAEQRRVDEYLSRYTGETVVMKVVGARLVEQTPRPLRSASHPGQRTSTWGQDVNADGQPDLAFLQPGVYRYAARLDAEGRFDAAPGVVTRVCRDLDHDGTISSAESTRDYVGAGIQLHYGGLVGPGSIGCQTFPPDDFRTLQRLVEGVTSFTYVLVRRASAM